MFDTNVAILLRDGHPETSRRVAEMDGDFLLSVVTQVELYGGGPAHPADAATRGLRTDTLVASVSVVVFDEEAATIYRRIVSALGYSRTRVLDRMIAAQAIAHRARLVTCDASDFRKIPGLEIEVWTST